MQSIAFVAAREGSEAPRPATAADLERVQADLVAAARRYAAARFAAVELHRRGERGTRLPRLPR